MIPPELMPTGYRKSGISGGINLAQDGAMGEEGLEYTTQLAKKTTSTSTHACTETTVIR